MSQETVLCCIILLIQWVQNDEVRLWRAQLIKGAVVRDINAEERDVEVIAIIIEETHEQSGWSESRTHLQIPFIHVSNQQQHRRVRREAAMVRGV